MSQDTAALAGDVGTMPDDGLGTSKQAAKYLGVSPWTLYEWNSRGTAPRSYFVGRERKYRKRDLDEWLESRVTEPTPAA